MPVFIIMFVSILFLPLIGRSASEDPEVPMTTGQAVRAAAAARDRERDADIDIPAPVSYIQQNYLLPYLLTTNLNLISRHLTEYSILFSDLLLTSPLCSASVFSSLRVTEYYLHRSCLIKLSHIFYFSATKR